jgi:prefoldin subunit 5
MHGRQSFAVALVVCAGLVLLAAPALGLTDGVLTQEDVDNETTNESDALGQQISSFAQASAADANATMDMGMWNASVNDSDDAESEVDGRLSALERRLERLQNRSDELEAMRDNETIHEQVYEARASAIQRQIANVESAINHTNETAQRYGVAVDADKLERLRSNASNMTGPEVSAIARNLTNAPRGPPADAGPPDHAGPGNETDGGPPDAPGQNDNETDAGPGDGDPPGQAGGPDDGNETGGGPPDDAGPGDKSGGGPPQDDGGDDSEDTEADTEDE